MTIEIEIVEKVNDPKIKKMVFVEVDKKEAIAIINSLSAQMLNNNPNVGRLESYTKEQTYFSIGVIN